MIKAVIFDMDGLMIETEHLQSAALKKVLNDYGIIPEYNIDGVIQVVGLSARDNFRLLKRKHKILEVDQLVAHKNKAYYEIIQNNIIPKQGLFKLIKTFNKKRIKMAIASSSQMEDILFVLKKLGLKKNFDAIVCGDDVKRSKPYPDIYLKAAKMLKITPIECLILEDAESGVACAKLAGMKVTAIPSKYTKSSNFNTADLILSSLDKINLNLIESM